MPEIIFFLIALGLIVFAFLTVTSRDIFHSAVWLSLTLLSVAAIYFYLNAQFLGVIQVLVYIGGIVTLFVFAIKLTAQIGEKGIKQTSDQVFLSAIASLLFLFVFLRTVSSDPWAKAVSTGPSFSLPQIGYSLLTTYMLPFEFISLILLAVLVGAIVIGKVHK